MESQTQSIILWPLALYFVAVVVVAAGMLGLSYVLGQRHHDRATGEPYESGIVSTGSARLRFDAKFYLNAVLFVVFDLESVFVVAWAVALRQAGWAGYVTMFIFIGVILVALIYLGRSGALDWSPPGRRGRLIEPTPDRFAATSARPAARTDNVTSADRAGTDVGI